MIYFFIGVLLVFPTLISISTSVSKSETICSLQDPYPPIVVSIFNLGKDLILHLNGTHPNHGDAFGPTFWRVYGTDNRPILGSYDDPNDKSTIDQRIRDRVYKMNKFNAEISDIGNQFGKDNDMNVHFSPDRSLAAIRVKASKFKEVRTQTCVNPNDNIKEKCSEFTQLWDKYGNDMYCMFNKDLKTFKINYGYGLPIIYDPPGGQLSEPNAQHIILGPKILETQKICYEFSNRTSILVLSDYDNQDDTVLEVFKTENKHILKVIQGNTEKQKEIDTSQIYHLFRFNDYYDVMSCPEICTLNTKLFKISLERSIQQTIQKIIITSTELTINRLIGCQQKSAPFDPFYFCFEERLFESVLSFGEELYFQQSGRFWRYNSFGFNKEKDAIGPKLGSMRLDSDMTALLEKEGIDTSRTVIGFSFDYGHFDVCPEDKVDDAKCALQLYHSAGYYQVCIIGFPNQPKSQQDKDVSVYLELEHTPFGLKTIEIREDLKSRPHCKPLVTKINSLSDTTIEKAGGGGNYALHSIVFRRSTTRMSEYFGHQIWTLYEESPNQKFYIIWTAVKAMEEKTYYPDFDTIIAKQAISKLEDETWVMSSLFNWGNQLYLYHNRSLQIVIDSFEMSKNDSTDPNDITKMEIKIQESEFSNDTLPFYKILKCPFKSSTSLVAIKRELVCHNNDNSLAQSMFLIGKHIYYQLGQHFYKFNEFNSYLFYYDKYVSDLLNDYFDTRHRVTAMSIPNTFGVSGIKYYAVIIHGKSHQNYRDIGQYINGYFSINASELTPLWGRKVSYFTYLGLGDSDYKGADNFDEGLAFWSNEKLVYKQIFVWISRYNYTDTSVANDLKMWMYCRRVISQPHIIPESSYRYILYHKFYLMDWTKTELGQIGSDQLPFDEIIGLVDVPKKVLDKSKKEVKDKLKDHPLLLLARKAEKAIQIYLLYDTTPSNAPTVDFKKFTVSLTFDQLFCTQPESSDTESSISSKLNTLIAVLIILLLCLVLFIAYYSYRVNQKRIKNNMRTEMQMKNSEHQSVGQHSNQMDAKPEETSAQNSDTSSKTSDSLSTRSQ